MGFPPSASLYTTSLVKWQNFSFTGKFSCSIKIESKPFLILLDENTNLAVCREDVVLIKAAAVAPNTTKQFIMLSGRTRLTFKGNHQMPAWQVGSSRTHILFG